MQIYVVVYFYGMTNVYLYKIVLGGVRKHLVCLSLIVSGCLGAKAQNYISYFTGDTTDVETIPTAGTVLMGGATENDNAMRWFLERAGGGDVVVLRTTGDDGYNDYFYSDLGVIVNSVETIICNDAASGADPYVIHQVENAEALWFAGGDQWDYIQYWRNTPLEDVFNVLINDKKIPIGGTSAGCAIQGEAYFSAENGTITSTQALHDPYHNLMTLGYSDFIDNPATKQIITDTHYDNPDRRGRHIAFLARLYQETGVPYYGIGVEEYTAVCIDENNIAHVYGSYPYYDDYAYFLQVNCVEPNTPETCVDGSLLTWDRSSAAVKVIKMAGMDFGEGSVDLNDWKTAVGADFQWEDWSVDNAIFSALEMTSPINCDTVLAVENNILKNDLLYPNPTTDYISIQSTGSTFIYRVLDISGDCVLNGSVHSNNWIDVSSLAAGIYVIEIRIDNNFNYQSFLKQ